MKTIKQMHKALSEKEISVIELAQEYINKIKKDNTGAFLNTNWDNSQKEIAYAQSLYDQKSANLLTGIPLAHKDVFCLEGWETTAGSKMLKGYTPSYSASFAKRLQEIGMVCLGKLAMDEFAMGSYTTSSPFGVVKSPLDPERTVGGSSGGSGAAIAAGLVPLASGSDTGGSIRLPASFCGVYGIKPTYGAISRYGMIAYASSLDCPGFLGNCPEDLLHVLQASAFRDNKDSTSVGLNQEKYNTALSEMNRSDSKPLAGKKIAYIKEFLAQGVSPEVKNSFDLEIKRLTELGAIVVEKRLKATEVAVATYYILACAEASSNLSRYDGVKYGHRANKYNDLYDFYCKSRSEGFGYEVKRRIILGTHVLSAEFFDAYYLKAQKARRVIVEELLDILNEVHYIISPVAPTVAPKFSEISKMTPAEIYLGDIYTIPFSLAGLPSVAYPGASCGMPIGLQLIGRHLEDFDLLAQVELIKR